MADAEIQRSRARMHYGIAAIMHAEAEKLSDAAPERARLLVNRSNKHRTLAREALSLLKRLRAEWGAELEELVAVHDLTFALAEAQRSTDHGKD